MPSSVHNYPTLAPIQGHVTASVEEVANALGVTRSVVYEAVRTGQLPSRRLGRRIVIPVPMLLEWLGASPDHTPFRPAGRPCRRAQ